jgi:hypothetical protein
MFAAFWPFSGSCNLKIKLGNADLISSAIQPDFNRLRFFGGFNHAAQ